MTMPRPCRQRVHDTTKSEAENVRCLRLEDVEQSRSTSVEDERAVVRVWSGFALQLAGKI